LLRSQLDALGLADTRALARAPQGRWMRIPGLVLVRQRPGSAKGVVFFTVEDEHGAANLVLYPDIAEQFRSAVIMARLIVAEGRVERHEQSEVPIIHLLVKKLSDRSDLLESLPQMDGVQPWHRTLSRADEVVKPQVRRDAREERARMAARLPPSRDFH